MAIEPIFADAQGRQITYTELCRDIIGVTPRANVNSLMAVPNINMFAKYKPVRYARPGYVSNSMYWKGGDGKCGIDIPKLNRLTDITTANWSYVRPRSGMGDNEPAMLSDFYFYGRYNRSAIPFLAPYPFAYDYENYSGPFTILFSNMAGETGDDNLKMQDVPFLADKYLAVCIRTLSDSYAVTAEGTIGQGYYSVTVSAEWMKIIGMGTHDIYHFLTTERHTEGSQAPVVGIYPVYHDATHPNPQKVSVMPYSSKLEFSQITQYASGYNGELFNIEDTYTNPVTMPELIFFPITAVNKTEYTIYEEKRIHVDITYANGLTHSIPLNYLYDGNWNTLEAPGYIVVPAKSSKNYYLGVDISFFPHTGEANMTYFSFRFAAAAGFGFCSINLRYN